VLVSGIIGLAPALALLFLVLRKYDYPYTEKALFDAKKVFLMLAVGIVFGMIVTVLYATIPVVTGTFVELLPILLLAVGLVVFEEMFKFVALNIKKLQLKFDTVFYGFSLGVGISSTFVLSHVYASIRFSAQVPLLTWAILIIYSITLCLIHGSTGIIIGFGSAKGRPWHYFFEALVIRIFLIIVLIPILVNIGEEWVQAVSLSIAFLISLIIFYYTSKDRIPDALPDSIRRQRRIKSRRIIRRKA